jgi:HAD superfamily hydrolase (TIGR01509 family)
MLPIPSGFNFKSGLYPEAVLCDMDGLLLDTEQLSKRSFDDLIKDHSIPNADEIFPQLIGLNKTGHLTVFRSTLPKGIDVEAFDAEWKTRYHALLSDNIPVKDGVRDFLSLCHDLNIPIAVVTSTKTTKAEDLLARVGLIEFFVTVVGGDKVENGKPHPDIYLHAAKALSADVTNCLALEDSNNGVLSACRAGVKTIQIPDLAPQSEEVANFNIPTLSGIADVPPYLGWAV